jgi:hypothetical protein
MREKKILLALFSIGLITFYGGLLYMIIHFIMKFW